jgi:hypothetical protein
MDSDESDSEISETDLKKKAIQEIQGEISENDD